MIKAAKKNPRALKVLLALLTDEGERSRQVRSVLVSSPEN